MIWLAIILIILGVGLVVGEFFVGSGIMLVAGVAALLSGLIILFTQSSILVTINWWIMVPLILALLGLIVFIILRIIHTYHRQVVTGKEEMAGKTVIVKKTLNPEGLVLYDGEYWDALSESGIIETGEEALIDRIEGFKLFVKSKPKN